MNVTVRIVNAFINNGNGGNPAGVVLDADDLTHQQKLSIAKEVGLSETAFVSKSILADFKLDFYTPSLQIAHCGHATIAVFSYLAQLGKVSQGIYTKETIDGNRKIVIEGNMAYMQQLAPKYTTVQVHHKEILNSIGVTQHEISSLPLLVSTGNSFIIIGVKDKNILANLKLKFEAIKAISEKLDLIGFYIYTEETKYKHNDVSTRMFFPRYGVNEESATGMAAGPMACFLYDKMGFKKDKFNIEQGYFMPKPSASKIVVELDIEKENIISLMAGGVANISKEMFVKI